MERFVQVLDSFRDINKEARYKIIDGLFARFDSSSGLQQFFPIDPSTDEGPKKIRELMKQMVKYAGRDDIDKDDEQTHGYKMNEFSVLLSDASHFYKLKGEDIKTITPEKNRWDTVEAEMTVTCSKCNTDYYPDLKGSCMACPRCDPQPGASQPKKRKV